MGPGPPRHRPHALHGTRTRRMQPRRSCPIQSPTPDGIPTPPVPSAEVLRHMKHVAAQAHCVCENHCRATGFGAWGAGFLTRVPPDRNAQADLSPVKKQKTKNETKNHAAQRIWFAGWSREPLQTAIFRHQATSSTRIYSPESYKLRGPDRSGQRSAAQKIEGA